jgi:hypothetical protein
LKDLVLLSGINGTLHKNAASYWSQEFTKPNKKNQSFLMMLSKCSWNMTSELLLSNMTSLIILSKWPNLPCPLKQKIHTLVLEYWTTIVISLFN